MYKLLFSLFILLSVKASAQSPKEFAEKSSVVFVLTYSKGQTMPSKIESLVFNIEDEEKLETIKCVDYELATSASYDGQRQLYMSYKEGNGWFSYCFNEIEKGFIIVADTAGNTKKVKWDEFIKTIVSLKK